MKFPSREWCEALAAALLRDPSAASAAAGFGPVVAGLVIEKGGGLEEDFCVLLRGGSGTGVALEFPEDEDELEELEPDYVAWAPYPLCKALLEDAQRGGRPDALRAILERRVRLRGDLERLLKYANRHRGAGIEAIRAIPTEFV